MSREGSGVSFQEPTDLTFGFGWEFRFIKKRKNCFVTKTLPLVVRESVTGVFASSSTMREQKPQPQTSIPQPNLASTELSLVQRLNEDVKNGTTQHLDSIINTIRNLEKKRNRGPSPEQRLPDRVGDVELGNFASPQQRLHDPADDGERPNLEDFNSVARKCPKCWHHGVVRRARHSGCRYRECLCLNCTLHERNKAMQNRRSFAKRVEACQKECEESQGSSYAESHQLKVLDARLAHLTGDLERYTKLEVYYNKCLDSHNQNKIGGMSK